MARKLWINWEDRYFFYDEIAEDIIVDTMFDICYEEEPDFKEECDFFLDANEAKLKTFLGEERFAEVREQAIERVESLLDYYEF